MWDSKDMPKSDQYPSGIESVQQLHSVNQALCTSSFLFFVEIFSLVYFVQENLVLGVAVSNHSFYNRLRDSTFLSLLE